MNEQQLNSCVRMDDDGAGFSSGSDRRKEQVEELVDGFYEPLLRRFKQYFNLRKPFLFYSDLMDSADTAT